MVFFYYYGIVSHVFLQQCAVINKKFYLGIFLICIENHWICGKTVHGKNVLFQNFLLKGNTVVISQLFYSLYSLLMTFPLHENKKNMEGQRFVTNADVKQKLLNELKVIIECAF